MTPKTLQDSGLWINSFASRNYPFMLNFVQNMNEYSQDICGEVFYVFYGKFMHYVI